jgi:murein L,D-transpeptidase YcbB/YkuD
MSIVRGEILPAIAKNPNYLRTHNMEIIGGTKAAPVIRQKPGPNNALGRVKFLFPNRFDIYMHDTPARGAFALEKRAFSHGCIRLAEPEKLANYLLDDDPEWTPERIRRTMLGGRETTVELKQPRPVFILYFTAWVDRDGQLNFRDDLYGHDQKLAEELFRE